MTKLSDTQQVSGRVQPVSKRGNAADVEAGTSVFTSSDPSVIEIVADPADQLAVTVIARKAGAAQVQWEADADLGDGVVKIGAVADFVVEAGMATGASFSFGTPVEQPE